MGKQGKRKKNLLKHFVDIDNETLSKYLFEEIYKYYVLKKSTDLAREILSKYNVYTYKTINDYMFNRYEILLELATLRDIKVPLPNEVEVTNIDIIFRIEEFKNEETNWIEEHNYLFDTYNPHQDNYPKPEIIDMIPDEHTYPSNKKIEEVIQQYEEIILKEFGPETKKLYEEKRNEYLSRDLETMYKEVMPIKEIPKVLLREKR